METMPKLVKEKTIDRISYSYLMDYKNCPQYYKLKHILGFKDYENSVVTIHGTLIHNHVQDLLSNKIDKEHCIVSFKRRWKKFCGLYDKFIDKEKYKIEDMGLAGEKIIENIEDKLKLQFGNFKVLEIEELLNCKIENSNGINFKGFIDIVIQLENGDIVIADFKNCSSVYMFKEFQDKFKDYQLTYYKKYYCQKHNFDPKKIETYFILLERNPKSKNLIEVLRVTSGDKKISNASEYLNNSLRNITEKQIFTKMKNHCNAYGKQCKFYDMCHK